ncbi:MAG TPA: serine--tRNA ligase [Actinobacteria bacterium]|nr:serine--tRNA ligase [bacterium BMS3Bbin01]HDH26490.1 serine--tRNA ligase [Actinomycetota bacterium]
MIDPVILREDPDRLRRSLVRRGVELSVDELVDLDRRKRSLRAEAEQARAKQKEIGKEISRLQGEAKQTAISQAKALADEYQRLLALADEADEQFTELWVTVPNLAHDSVPEGFTDDDAVEVKRWGKPRDFDFDPLDHQALGEALGLIDVERGVRTSGARFGYLKGQAVLLEMGLVRWAMDLAVAEGSTLMVPPVLVREEALFGTGFFPDDSEQVYAVEKDRLYLVGTAEVPLAAYHADEILDEEMLPIRYAGFSTCFRREAGTYGKDTRGIFRVHQFDKLEMFSFCHPDASWEEHERLLTFEERIVQGLELPYRVVNIPVGDLGASAAKKYDIEAWFPSMGRYREVTSCSNTTDFQSRRLKIRFRSEAGNQLVHTLNGTVVAVGRTILAILENHQQADGTVKVPAAIRPYVGFDVIGS